MSKRTILITSLMVFLAPLTVFVSSRALAAGDLTPHEARRLIAHLAGIQLPSDAVRIKDISSLGNSAVVVAQVETAFRLVKGDNDQWRVADIRTGDRRWEDIDLLVRALNAEKAARARAELESIATALESYRRDHGFYVESKSEAVLIDHLSPRYLTRVIRLDPWHQPYEYEGARNSFLLRSVGPDGKSGTTDDLIVANIPR
jgi:type II secretion system (T2SS) protein G